MKSLFKWATGLCRGVQQTFSRRQRAMQLLSALLVIASRAHAEAASTELEDLAARIQFAYYSEDARALRVALNELQHLESPDDTRLVYHSQLAYGHWKLAELLAATDKSAAADNAGQCVEEAGQVTEALRADARVIAGKRAGKQGSEPQPDANTPMAEAYALKAACVTLFPRISDRLRAPLRRITAAPELAKAAALQPSNPRVLLVEAIADYDAAVQSHDDPMDDSMTGAYRKLVAAVAAFDAEGTSVGGTLEWGYAEALAYLGKILLLRNNSVEARNTLERAVMMTPDYRWAQRTLASLPNSRPAPRH